MAKLKILIFVGLIATTFFFSAFARQNFTSTPDTDTGGGGGPAGCIIETVHITNFSAPRGTHSEVCGTCYGWMLTEYPNPYRTGVYKYQQTSKSFSALVMECEQTGSPADDCYGQNFTGINCGDGELPPGATETDTWEDTGINTDTL